MADTRGYGCGIWPFILNKTGFATACYWHDMAYTEDSWHQEHQTRKEVDRWFLKLMLTIAKDNKWRKVRAYSAYGIVRALGWYWWEGEE